MNFDGNILKVMTQHLVNDVYKLILLNLDLKDLLNCRLSNKQMMKNCEFVLDKIAFKIDSEDKFIQIVSWVYEHTECLSIKCSSNDHNHNNDCYYYNDKGFCHKYYGCDCKSIIHEYKHTFAIIDNSYYASFGNDFECHECLINEDFNNADCDKCGKWLLPNFTLNDALYLEYPIVLYNRRGINYDKRGIRYDDLEFSLFEDSIMINKGYITVRNFIFELFKLKSHKFENWYELVTGVRWLDNIKTFMIKKEDQIIFSGNLCVDHGS